MSADVTKERNHADEVITNQHGNTAKFFFIIGKKLLIVVVTSAAAADSRRYFLLSKMIEFEIMTVVEIVVKTKDLIFLL